MPGFVKQFQDFENSPNPAAARRYYLRQLLEFGRNTEHQLKLRKYVLISAPLYIYIPHLRCNTRRLIYLSFSGKWFVEHKCTRRKSVQTTAQSRFATRGYDVFSIVRYP